MDCKSSASLKYKWLCRLIISSFIKNHYIMLYDNICSFTILTFWWFSFYMVTQVSFCIFHQAWSKATVNWQGSSLQTFKVHIAIIYTYLTIPLVLLSDQLISSHLFGKVTYVTAILSTYIPNMIHQSHHHTSKTYIDWN